MGKKQTIYISSDLEAAYEQLSMIAQSCGMTTIEYLITQHQEYEKIKESLSGNKQDFKGYTIHLGENTKHDQPYISFYGKLLFDETVEETYNVRLYEGIQNKKMLFFTLSDSEGDYYIVDTLEEVVEEILDIPNRMEEAGYEAQDDDEIDWRIKTYQDIANKVCAQFELPLVGNDVKRLIF